MTDNVEESEPSGAQKMFGDFAPALVGFTDDVLFGQVWTRWPKVMSAMAIAKQVFRAGTD
jgi:4-carboxymuconolactone decarboxylase